MKTVIGLFDEFSQAKQAALDLEKAGIPHDAISLVANNQSDQHLTRTETGETDTAAEDTTYSAGSETAKGAMAGGVAGLLIGLAPFLIPGLGTIAAVGWLTMTLAGAGIGAAVGLVGALTHIGVPHEEATYYNEGVKRGGTLLAVKSEDTMAERVAQILEEDGAVNIDERAAQWKQEGFQPVSSQQADLLPTSKTPQPAVNTMPDQRIPTTEQNVQAQTPPAASVERNLANQGEAALPVVEEQLQVGKRPVQRGGVRVYTHVTQQPVEENVQLREEHVNVERRPVDRPVNPADMAAFKEGTIEVKETAEEPVVAKQARVVEEVVVNKEASERTETVRDTVRRTDVDVQPLGTEHTSRTRSFDTFEPDFKNNFQANYANQGMTYEQFTPAYQYGYDLANNQQYSGQDWAAMEPDIRQNWEARQPGTWDKFKNAIRYSWDKATGAQKGGIQTGGQDIDGTPDTRGIMEKTADAVTGDRIDDKTGKPVS